MEVYVPTWNSERTLNTCLSAIKKAVPNHNITIIDRNSTDNTQTIAQNHGCTIISENLNLGQARTRAINLAKDEWFIMVDSDTYLCPNWFNEVWALKEKLIQTDPHVGIIQGESVPMLEPYHSYVLYAYAQARSHYPAKNVKRLLTSCILLRKEAVCNFKADAPVYEDWLIGKHLRRKGYNFYVAQTQSAHDGPANMKMLADHAKWGGAGLRLYYKMPLWKLLGALFIIPLFRTPFKWKRLVWHLQWNWLLGWWMASKYKELKR